MILLSPDGKPPSRRWRTLAWLAGAVMVLASLGIALAPGPLEGHPGVRNPFGLEGAPWIKGATVAIILLLPVCILASALTLVLRYRRSGQEVREQIKWIAFAARIMQRTRPRSTSQILSFYRQVTSYSFVSVSLWFDEALATSRLGRVELELVNESLRLSADP